MEWVLGVGFLGAIAYLWERGKRADVEKELALSKALAFDLKRQFHQEEDRANRNEMVVNLLRGDIRGLQDELEKCAVPGSVRDRLNRVLAAPDRKPAI